MAEKAPRCAQGDRHGGWPRDWTVLEGGATRLLLSDGSEIFCPDEPVFWGVSAGTAAAVSYQISGGRKVAETLTIVPPLKRLGH